MKKIITMLVALLLVVSITTIATSANDPTVYITKSGKKYHWTSNCNGLNGASAIYTTTLSSAISSGKTECSLCGGGHSVSSAGWKKSSGKWWYQNSNGSYPRNTWMNIGGYWYHFDSSGYMQTGWLKDGGKWYFLNSDGTMATGWVKSGSKWYYMNSSGAMQTGWVKVGSKYYYMDSSGAMQANKWIGNYYVKSSGEMATNEWIGKYHVNASGKWDATK